MTYTFHKMQSCGNDFVIVDALTQKLPNDREAVAQQLVQTADRHKGIGWDQLLIIYPPANEQVDFAVAIYNADGSQASNCINGLRCVLSHLCSFNLWSYHKSATVQVVGSNAILTLCVVDTDSASPVVRATMSSEGVSAESCSQKFQQRPAVQVTLGNAHLIVFCDEAPSDDEFETWGRATLNHDLFPDGVNMTTLWPNASSSGDYSARVYERGVGETLACGTAALAVRASLESADRDQPAMPEINIHVPGGVLTAGYADSTYFVQGETISVFHGMWMA